MWIRLPTALVATELFSYLTLKEVSICSRVCKSWHQAFQMEAVWKHFSEKNALFKPSNWQILWRDLLFSFKQEFKVINEKNENFICFTIVKNLLTVSTGSVVKTWDEGLHKVKGKRFSKSINQINEIVKCRDHFFLVSNWNSYLVSCPNLTITKRFSYSKYFFNDNLLLGQGVDSFVLWELFPPKCLRRVFLPKYNRPIQEMFFPKNYPSIEAVYFDEMQIVFLDSHGFVFKQEFTAKEWSKIEECQIEKNFSSSQVMGSFIVCGSQSGLVHIISVKEMNRTSLILDSPLLCLEFRERRLYIGCQDGSITVLDDHLCIVTTLKKDKGISNIQVTEDAIVASYEGRLTFWDPVDFKEIATFRVNDCIKKFIYKNSQLFLLLRNGRIKTKTFGSLKATDCTKEVQ